MIRFGELISNPIIMEDAKVIHEYTHAIVAKIPSNGRANRDPELNVVRIEHESLVRLIRELGLEVVEADTSSDEKNFPANIFIEEYAIVWNGTALMMRPTTDEEAEKTLALQNVLENMQFKVRHVGEFPAQLNMADVLFTGREFFVGISDTSNMEGACCIASTFPEYSCSLVKACYPRHLKHYISIAGPDVLCVVSNPIGKDLLRKVEANATFNYKTVTVPEEEAANCLYLNGHLVHRAIEEIPVSFKVFCEKIDFSRRSICFTEIAKHNKGLSSCCLLVKHPVI